MDIRKLEFYEDKRPIMRYSYIVSDTVMIKVDFEQKSFEIMERTDFWHNHIKSTFVKVQNKYGQIIWDRYIYLLEELDII